LDVLAAFHQFSEASHQHILVLCFELIDMVLADDFQVEEWTILGDIAGTTQLFSLLFFLWFALDNLLDEYNTFRHDLV
jgi:hypothetical protein